MVRYTVHFSGRVQGVGFRDAVRRVAQGCSVSGYVQNLDDGRVLAVAEGEPAELDRFLQEIADRMGYFIRDRQVSRDAATGEFEKDGAFVIRR